MHVLFIDNFDSFSFNLVDDLRRRGATVEVWRHDIPATLALERCLEWSGPRLIMLSPGPGAPADAGCCVELVRRAEQRALPLVGVCLGHQAIVEALGGSVERAPEVVHGKAARITHDGTSLFRGLPSPLSVGRYHSLVATRLPDSLRVCASLDGMVMAVEHTAAPIAGLQFHPESLLTTQGSGILDNIFAWVQSHDVDPRGR